MDANNATRKKYWHHWCAYIQPLRIESFIQKKAALDVILTTTGFIDRVRRGYYGNEIVSQFKHLNSPYQLYPRPSNWREVSDPYIA